MSLQQTSPLSPYFLLHSETAMAPTLSESSEGNSPKEQKKFIQCRVRRRGFRPSRAMELLRTSFMLHGSIGLALT